MTVIFLDPRFQFLFFCVFGACIGSFLGVIVYRMPRGFLLGLPRRSTCTSCFRKLSIRENIPLISYLVQKGRCCGCGASIGGRALLLEVLAATLFGAVVLHKGWGIRSLYYCYLAASLLAITFIDLDFRIIPDKLSLTGLFVGILLSPLLPQWSLLQSVAGATLGGGSFWLVSYLYFKATGREGLGFGDVKLLAFIGAFLGVSGVLGTIFISSLLGSVIGITLMLVRRQNMKMAIPYGPFLAIGALCMLFWGDFIFNGIFFPIG